jgi:hypothetical protein
MIIQREKRFGINVELIAVPGAICDTYRRCEDQPHRDRRSWP